MSTLRHAVRRAPSAPITEGQAALAKALRKKKERPVGQEKLSQDLTLLGISHCLEFRALPPRLWRFDLAIPAGQPWLLIEVHGSVFQNGAHTRGKGFTDDREKMSTATSRGFHVIECTTKQATSGQALQWILDTLKDHQCRCRQTDNALENAPHFTQLPAGFTNERGGIMYLHNPIKMGPATRQTSRPLATKEDKSR